MRLGLISDTHMPMRWPALPDAVRQVFEGADLVLHAGDVGELWVLDELASIAPVVAVHGNDDTPEAQAALPYQALLVAAGVRVLLCHSHQPDATAERAARSGDDWGPKLAVRAEQARRHGATVYVFGHTHIPMSKVVDGVLLVNPGAIASGNAFCRQVCQSVAVLEVGSGSWSRVVHHRVDHLGDVPQVVWEDGFASALSAVSEPIVTSQVHELWARARDADPKVRRELHELVLSRARRRWAGDPTLIEVAELLQEAEAEGVGGGVLDLLAGFVGQ